MLRTAPKPSSLLPRAAPGEGPKEVLGLCRGEATGDVSLQAWAGPGCVEAGEGLA